MIRITAVKIVDKALRVDFDNGKTTVFEDCWLRDHCRCAECYNASTYQRAQHILDIPEVDIYEIQHDKDRLIVTWEDRHLSEFTSDFLAQFDYETWNGSRRPKPTLWNGNKVIEKVARVDAKMFLKSEEAAREVFKSLLDYGVAFVTGLQATVQDTESVCNALGGVQETLFGGMWEFTTVAKHADTAYTALPLASHHDNTYFTEAAGLQILHCLEHTNGSGGDTTLTDGFYGASRLREEHPEDFKFLSTFDLEAEYIEPGHHHKYAAPVIKLNDDVDIVQVRFNVYDRSAVAFRSSEECRTYYRSLRNLARYYQDPANQWQFKLTPGVAVVMDNFRVLHGRTAFTGNRRMCGSYVSRANWLEKARLLKLIS
ncbi:taurine catabolism dioxygenase tauD, tfdA family domain-containing protein [Phthorimaea operculella]|nr:taurine catabolism dioxygenase tauD, tfdA family domain-containing protein [Phthorimaea operculella]